MFSNHNQFNSLILNGKKEVFSIINDDELTYNSSTLTCLGGGSFHKGLSIGMQDKMVPGLLIYDDENFFGFSQKNGLILLSHNIDFKELEMPLFNPSIKDIQKILNIDLTFRDSPYFFISIPSDIITLNISLNLKINFIHDDESIINNINFFIINNLNKDVKIDFINKNLFISGSKIKSNSNSIIKFNVTFINSSYITCQIDKFLKK